MNIHEGKGSANLNLQVATMPPIKFWEDVENVKS